MKKDEKVDLENPLGIAQQPVPKAEHIRASADPDETRQRRRRVRETLNERRTDGLGDLDRDPSAARGVDIGADKP